MEIVYRNKKIEKICNDSSKSIKKYGEEMTEKIQLRIDQISSTESVDWLIKYKVGRCHTLSGDRYGQYAIDLVQPYRLVFFVNKSNTIQIAEIVEIIDYH